MPSPVLIIHRTTYVTKRRFKTYRFWRRITRIRFWHLVTVAGCTGFWGWVLHTLPVAAVIAPVSTMNGYMLWWVLPMLAVMVMAARNLPKAYPNRETHRMIITHKVRDSHLKHGFLTAFTLLAAKEVGHPGGLTAEAVTAGLLTAGYYWGIRWIVWSWKLTFPPAPHDK